MLKPRPIKKSALNVPRYSSHVKPNNPFSSVNKYQSQKEVALRTPETTSFLEVTPLFRNNTRGLQSFQDIRPKSLKPFRSSEVQKATEFVLEDYLTDKLYERQQCNHLSQLISSKILEKLQQLGYHRYKMVAIVSIGSMKERPGMQFGSRCLWNKETDNFISAKYSNSSLFAVAMVYGLCFD